MTEENEIEEIEENEELVTLHQEALREFDEIQASVRDERLQCLQDRRFYSIAGAQWEGSFEDQFENKPRLEVNKIHLAVMRIFSEYRNNRITVNFLSKEGSDNDDLADTCDGLYRADEEDSCAEEAYDNAFEEAVGGGFGAWRLRAEYEDDEDEEDERQRIKIEPIPDADSSVFYDLNAKRQDKSDATKCYVLTSMTHSAFKDEWGEDPASWPKEIDQSEFDWVKPDVVYVAELYMKEEATEIVRIFENIDGTEEFYPETEFELDEGLEERLIAIGSKEVRQKKVKRRKVRKLIMSGSRVLEDCGYIAGSMIPIVPVYGKRWFVDNIERCMGHVRLAKDAQRLKNMQLSKLAELSSLSSVEKPIFTPEQMAGHTDMWAEDNITNYPYMLINPITDAAGNQAASGPIGYTKPPQIAPALAALLQIAETDIQDLLGNQQAGEKMISNISGDAIQKIQDRLDMQTFIYMSNMAKAMKRSGEVWLSIARDILVEPGRKMKTIGMQNELGSVEISKPVMKEGKVVYENDISKAKFDVTSSVGPSSSSKRNAIVSQLMNMRQAETDPETQQVISAMIMMNMEGEGLQDARDFFRQKLIRMGAVKPTEEEQKELMAELQNQQPDAQTNYLNAAAAEAQAKAQKAEADTIGTLAKAEETKAKTIETLAGVDRDDQKAAIETAKAMAEAIIGAQETRTQPEAGGIPRSQ